ncbi:MAG: hypothetical protein ACKOAD_09185 [Gammaproteobacteria bacterium]
MEHKDKFPYIRVDSLDNDSIIVELETASKYASDILRQVIVILWSRFGLKVLEERHTSKHYTISCIHKQGAFYEKYALVNERRESLFGIIEHFNEDPVYGSFLLLQQKYINLEDFKKQINDYMLQAGTKNKIETDIESAIRKKFLNTPNTEYSQKDVNQYKFSKDMDVVRKLLQSRLRASRLIEQDYKLNLISKKLRNLESEEIDFLVQIFKEPLFDRHKILALLVRHGPIFESFVNSIDFKNTEFNSVLKLINLPFDIEELDHKKYIKTIIEKFIKSNPEIYPKPNKAQMDELKTEIKNFTEKEIKKRLYAIQALGKGDEIKNLKYLPANRILDIFPIAAVRLIYKVHAFKKFFFGARERIELKDIFGMNRISLTYAHPSFLETTFGVNNALILRALEHNQNNSNLISRIARLLKADSYVLHANCKEAAAELWLSVVQAELRGVELTSSFYRLLADFVEDYSSASNESSQ